GGGAPPRRRISSARDGAPPVRGKGPLPPRTVRPPVVRTFFLPVLSGPQAHLEEGVMTRESPRRNLDRLKKEAKRWLAELRQDVRDARARLARALPTVPQSPTLRDVQLALAREQGFPGWTALKRALTPDSSASRKTLEQYEDMASALLEAYRTGTPEAMERHYRYTWHRRAWTGMRTYVQLDLGKRA